jgi:predicted RNA polymerase sigma factor
VALTLRAVGGLSTPEIADAFYVPEATMAQRISRAKRALQGRRLDEPGDLAVLGDRHRWHAVRAHLHELDGDLPAAGAAYAKAARRATNVAERNHLVRQAARARAAEL